MIREGGSILWVIIGLSVITFIMVLYFFFTITPAREVPPNLLKRALSQIRAGDLRGAYQMCEGRDELLANVIKSGLKMAGHDRYVIQEAMESEGERGATALWQRISYVNNVGAIAPLLGLLGTVWGMIRAFGAIAFDDAQSRGLVMAYSVSQAMITTAAGLMLAQLLNRIASFSVGSGSDMLWILAVSLAEGIILLSAALGAAGRIAAILGLILVGTQQAITGISPAQVILIVAFTMLLFMGTGRLSLWTPEEEWIHHRAGEKRARRVERAA